MGNVDNKILLEHLNKLKYLSNYVLSETAKYHPVIDGVDEYDKLPENIFLGNHQINEDDPEIPDTENIGGDEMNQEVPEEPSIDKPEVNMVANQDLSIDSNQTTNTDILQNQIIQTNIEAMKKLNQKIKELELSLDNVNSVSKNLQKEVEEVREPSNVEKLVNKKQDSHPFYYGLNDMWKDNWFQGRRDETSERGIIKIADNKYVADFDDLPKYSQHDIKNSFNSY